MKHFATLALMVAVVAFALPTAHAAEGQIISTVTIECAAEVLSNGGALDFGYLAAPSIGTDFWTVTPFNGALLEHTGDGNGFDFLDGDHSKGGFTIIGSELMIYSVTVGADFSDPNLHLFNLTLDPPSPQDPGLGNGDCLEMNISVGGMLEVWPGAAQGLHNDAVIIIQADY